MSKSKIWMEYFRQDEQTHATRRFAWKWPEPRTSYALSTEISTQLRWCKIESKSCLIHQQSRIVQQWLERLENSYTYLSNIWNRERTPLTTCSNLQEQILNHLCHTYFFDMVRQKAYSYNWVVWDWENLNWMSRHSEDSMWV